MMWKAIVNANWMRDNIKASSSIAALLPQPVDLVCRAPAAIEHPGRPGRHARLACAARSAESHPGAQARKGLEFHGVVAAENSHSDAPVMGKLAQAVLVVQPHRPVDLHQALVGG